MIVRSNSITTSSRWFSPRVRTVTIPWPGREADLRFSSTSVSARIVSPCEDRRRQAHVAPPEVHRPEHRAAEAAAVNGTDLQLRIAHRHDHSMAVTSRAWRGYDDLRPMQELAIEVRRREGRRAPWHIGDLAWGFRQHAGREGEWTIRIWEENGEVVAWSWLRDDPSGCNLDHDIHPRHRGGALHDELFAAAPEAVTAWAMDDDAESAAALTRHGFVAPGDAATFHARGLSDVSAAPLQLPDGFSLRTVEPADVAERVAIHQDVWAPSKVTEESYADVRATWPYRADLDCVVEAPDGQLAAYCLVWLDAANGVGEFEPVGTREPFRRRGLGAAVCGFGLRRLREEGAESAIVYSYNERAAALYDAVGFEPHTRVVAYSREPGGGTP
jgi:ribosomal protein S18 acetylase RimI-like enzyme